MPVKPPALFKRACLEWMPRLMSDFGFDRLDAAAVLGNAGHESNGLRAMQELNPTVKGSRGGLGAFQWTGPRHRSFEAWLKRQGKPANDLDASYAFLYRELIGTEKAAVPATKAAVGLEAKVKAFEMGFERAGVKHYPSRLEWAQAALAVYDERGAITPPARPSAVLPVQPSETLMRVYQQRLKDLGFYGLTIDGKWGDGTSAAIGAFKHANGLTGENTFDPAMVAVLMSDSAKGRVISKERATATASDIAPTAPIVREANQTEAAAGTTTVVVGSTGVAGIVASVLGYAAQVKETLGEVPLWAWAGIALAVVIPIGFTWYRARTIRARRVEMHRVAEVA